MSLYEDVMLDPEAKAMRYVMSQGEDNPLAVHCTRCNLLTENLSGLCHNCQDRSFDRQKTRHCLHCPTPISERTAHCSGLCPTCRKRAWKQRNHERILTLQRAWRDRRRQHILDYQRAWRDSHRAQHRAYQRDYARKHRKELRERNLAYYHAHRDEINRKRAERRKENACS